MFYSPAIMACSSATPTRCSNAVHYFDLLLRHQVEGIIAAATSRLWDVLDKAEMQHPACIYVDRVFEGLERPTSARITLAARTWGRAV